MSEGATAASVTLAAEEQITNTRGDHEGFICTDEEYLPRVAPLQMLLAFQRQRRSVAYMCMYDVAAVMWDSISGVVNRYGDTSRHTTKKPVSRRAPVYLSLSTPQSRGGFPWAPVRFESPTAGV